MTPAIELESLPYRYHDATQAPRGISFRIAPGECVGLDPGLSLLSGPQFHRMVPSAGQRALNPPEPAVQRKVSVRNPLP